MQPGRHARAERRSNRRGQHCDLIGWDNSGWDAAIGGDDSNSGTRANYGERKGRQHCDGSWLREVRECTQQTTGNIVRSQTRTVSRGQVQDRPAPKQSDARHGERPVWRGQQQNRDKDSSKQQQKTVQTTNTNSTKKATTAATRHECTARSAPAAVATAVPSRPSTCGKDSLRRRL